MITKSEYNKHVLRIEELLGIVGNDTPSNSKQFEELDHLSNLVTDYEERYFPVKSPTLIEVVKLRMDERGLNQKDLAKLLGVTASRVSEYIQGKRDITLNVAKRLHHQLNIDADIILQ